MEIAAGQGARAGLDGDVMRGLLREEGVDSCELVLFMLMVFPSCEGHHAPGPPPCPYCREALIRIRIKAITSWSNKLQRPTKRLPLNPPMPPYRSSSMRSGWSAVCRPIRWLPIVPT